MAQWVLRREERLIRRGPFLVVSFPVAVLLLQVPVTGDDPVRVLLRVDSGAG